MLVRGGRERGRRGGKRGEGGRKRGEGEREGGEERGGEGGRKRGEGGREGGEERRDGRESKRIMVTSISFSLSPVQFATVPQTLCGHCVAMTFSTATCTRMPWQTTLLRHPPSPPRYVHTLFE